MSIQRACSQKKDWPVHKPVCLEAQRKPVSEKVRAKAAKMQQRFDDVQEAAIKAQEEANAAAASSEAQRGAIHAIFFQNDTLNLARTSHDCENVVTDVDGLVEAVEHELSSNLEKASVFHSYASARMNGKRAHSTGGRGSLALRS